MTSRSAVVPGVSRAARSNAAATWSTWTRLSQPASRCSPKGSRVSIRKPSPPAPEAGLRQAVRPAASIRSTAPTSSSAVRTSHQGGVGSPAAAIAA